MSNSLRWAKTTSIRNRQITIPLLDQAGNPAGDLVVDQETARQLLHSLWVGVGYGPAHDGILLDADGTETFFSITSPGD